MNRPGNLAIIIVPVASAIAAAAAGCDRPATKAKLADRSRPTRIVALAPNAVEILWELGVGDRVIAVSEYTTYPPDAARLPKIGGVRDPDLETILGLDPDLIILRGRQSNLETLCKRHGIATFHDPTEKLADIYTTITNLGDVCGRPEEASAIASRLRAGLARVRAAVADRKPVPVLFCMRGPDRLANITTVARGSYLHEILEMAGGENIFGDLDLAYPRVSIEEIVVRQPAVIIEAMPGWTPSAGAASPNDLIDQWQSLDTIPAVRHRRIHALTENYVLVPSPRIVLLAEALAGLLHPSDAISREGARDE